MPIVLTAPIFAATARAVSLCATAASRSPTSAARVARSRCRCHQAMLCLPLTASCSTRSSSWSTAARSPAWNAASTSQTWLHSSASGCLARWAISHARAASSRRSARNCGAHRDRCRAWMPSSSASGSSLRSASARASADSSRARLPASVSAAKIACRARSRERKAVSPAGTARIALAHNASTAALVAGSPIPVITSAAGARMSGRPACPASRAVAWQRVRLASMCPAANSARAASRVSSARRPASEVSGASAASSARVANCTASS
jgi:hypothetical protein